MVRIVMIFFSLALRVGALKKEKHSKETECRLSPLRLTIDVIPSNNPPSKYAIRTTLRLTDHKTDDWIGIWSSNPILQQEGSLSKEEYNVLSKNLSSANGNVHDNLILLSTSSTRGGNINRNATLLGRRPVFSDVTTTDWDWDVLQHLEEENILYGHKNGACFSCWVGYVSDNKIIDLQCLRLNSFWMGNLGSALSGTPINQVLFPGLREEHTIVSYDKPFLSVSRQLIMGLRYIELDLDYHNHNLYTLYEYENVSLSSHLSDVGLFLKQNEEIVILNLKVPGNNSDYCTALEEVLANIAGSLVLPRNLPVAIPTVGMLWKSDQRLIAVSSECYNLSDLFWPLSQLRLQDRYLPNNQNAHVYKEEPEDNVNSNPNSLPDKVVLTSMSYQINLTDEDLINEVSQRKLEYKFYTQLRKDLWKRANIVIIPSSFSTSSLVHTAIEANKQKRFCQSYQNYVKNHKKLRFQKRAYRTEKKEDRYGHSSRSLEGCDIDVWPTIKALPVTENYSQEFRKIQLNWKVPEVFEDDIIALFDDDPRGQTVLLDENATVRAESTAVPLYVDYPFATEGTLTSPISFNRPSVFRLAEGGCVGPWVGYIRNSLVVSATCLKSNPKWMWENNALLAKQPLYNVVLPGTHNAGAYSTENKMDPISAFIVCQDEDILSQLLLGIRYLDLRISYYPQTTEKLWINHDKVKWMPLQKVLDDVRTFTFTSPDPVILDVHRTPVGFDDKEAKWLLVEMIGETLGRDLALSSLGEQVTARDLWKAGKTIIVSFGNRILRHDVPFLWRDIYQAWANAQRSQDLKNFLGKEVADWRNTTDDKRALWAAMAHLTPTVWDLIFKAGQGVRGEADAVGFLVRKWLKEDWKRDVNIICTDFFLTTDVIRTAIRLNSLCQDSCCH